MPMTEWLVSGRIRGEAVVAQDSYPIEYTLEDSETGERVVAQYEEPATESRPGPKEMPIGVQVFSLVVTASRGRAEALVERFLETVTAALSYGARRPVEWSVGPLVERVPEEDQAPEHRYLTSHAGTYRSVVPLHTSSFNRIMNGVGDWDDPKGRKLVRSLRWLSRSRQTQDSVETFSFLAMSLAAIHALLPGPGDTRDESTVLRHFAVAVVGVEEDDWIEVGGLRHELFHGGLLESPEARKRLSSAIPSLRRVVTEALRDLLDLPDDFPAEDPFDDLGLVVESVSFEPDSDDSEQ